VRHGHEKQRLSEPFPARCFLLPLALAADHTPVDDCGVIVEKNRGQPETKLFLCPQARRCTGYCSRPYPSQ